MKHRIIIGKHVGLLHVPMLEESAKQTRARLNEPSPAWSRVKFLSETVVACGPIAVNGAGTWDEQNLDTAGTKMSAWKRLNAIFSRHSASRCCLLLIVSLAVVLGAYPATAGMTVPLAWNASTDPTVVGYNLYYGTSPDSLTNVVSVGDVTSAAISGLTEGVTYYFAANAYNAADQESPLSNEVAYTIPAYSLLGIQALNSNGLSSANIVSLGALPDQWTLEESSDLQTWTAVAQGADGAVNLSFPAAGLPAQFFRLIGQ
jgi:hypothetical protein